MKPLKSGHRRRSYRVMFTTLAIFLAIPAASATATPRSASSGAGSTLAPTALRIDGQSSDPLVGAAQPTLSWTVNDAQRAQSQTGYEVRLSAGAMNHLSPQLIWDSGRVKSASPSARYGGAALLSDRSYVWSVRTWNAQRQASPWSTPVSFDSGLLTPSDWSASWLQQEPGALVRGGFQLTKPVRRARLYFGAEGVLEPHLNGARVDPNDLQNSLTDYASRVLYRATDVTDKVKVGSNELGFMVGQNDYAGRPTFVAQLDVTYADGTTAQFGSGPTWKTAAGPVTSDDFYYGETYDARKSLAGWDTAGFDDSGWALVHTIAPASHPQSLAQGQPVTQLDTTTCCGWSPAALTDGIDGSSDASQGYHSAAETDADHTKWVQVDLGSDQKISQLRLFPARPTNDTAGDLPGAGFPVRYQVQVSDDPAFATATTVVDHTDQDQPNPGLNPVTLPVDVTARYVRVTATRLYCNPEGCNFRLAELGVYGPSPATVFSGVTQLQADMTPPDQVVQTLTPVKVTHPGSGGPVYDFGQNYTGWVTISAAQPAGTKAVITMGEILDYSGNVTTSNIEFSPSDPPRQRDTYIFSGDGTETYAPHLRYDGFRYAQLSGLPDGAAVTVTYQVAHTAVATTGKFSTSNPLLNSIQGAVAQTQLNALQSIPVDCPTRERHGWLGDAGDSDQEAMSNYDMQAFYSKYLGDISTSQYADGSLPSVAPTNGRTDWQTDPAWGSAYPQIIWDSYLRYGGTSDIAANYQQVKAWVDYLATISDSDHIVVNSPTSYADDWVASVSTPHDYFQTGFYYLDATLLAKMAAVVGRSADATHYSDLANQIAAGFTKRYFNSSTDVYGTGTQLSQAMPLVLGIVPAGHEKAVSDKLVQDIAAHDNHVTTGFVGTTFVFQALGLTGHNDVALAIAERTDYPSFGYMLANGPGTIWEKWPNSSAPDGTSSKDHIGLGGAIGQWFYQQLAGIQVSSTEPGQLTLAPSVVGDLTHVSAQQQTARGLVKSSWQRNGAQLSYQVSIPVGTKATVKLPLLGGKQSTVLESGRTVLANGHSQQTDSGLSVGPATNDALTLTAGSGSYAFTVTPPKASFTSLGVVAGSPTPITAGGSGDLTALVQGRSTRATSVAVSASVPSGWTVSTTPAAIGLTPATTSTAVKLHVSVPVGTQSGSYPITVTARASDGTTATSNAVQLLVFGKWASGTSVSASSEHAPNEVDGATRTYAATNAIDGDFTSFWNDDTQDQYPDSLTVTAADPVALSGVGLASFPDGTLTDFQVQTWDGSHWVTQANVSNNSAVDQWIPFSAAVTTTQVRVVITGAQNSFSRVAELAP